jgi:hypothetical protein
MFAGREGHQLRLSNKAAQEGTRSVLTMKVSRRRPVATANPVWASPWTEEPISATNELAKMTPAEVITGPVAVTESATTRRVRVKPPSRIRLIRRLL